MELGKNSARIVDYGLTKTKMGSVQVFIKLLVGGKEDATWFGMPMKKDGESNDFMLTQLAYCGFDFSSHELEELAKGVDSGLLITSEDIDVYVRDETSPTGELVRRINTLGAMGPIRMEAEEVKSLITDDQKSKLKAAASKFKARKVVEKPKPSDDIPF